VDRSPVLLFRGQQLSDAELIAFSRRFGNLDVAPNQETGSVSSRPSRNLRRLKRRRKRSCHRKLGLGEAVWHTDMSYQADPPKRACCTRSKCRRAARHRLRQHVLAYEALPDTLKARLTDFASSMTELTTVRLRTLRCIATDDPIAAPGCCIRSYVLIRNPVAACFIWAPPQRLYRSLSLAESEALLDELWLTSLALSSLGTTAGRWRSRHVDNRCVMHRREPFDARTDGSCIVRRSRRKRGRRHDL